ncbi:MAG: roadblock/LC7 domain-containing protein, partial [Anaerolineae bacterium]
MAQRLLILDPDTAFATVLAEAIESLGTYEATAVVSLEQALAELRAHDYAMALVDPAALEVAPSALAERLRAVRPDLRLMWIGEEDNEEAQRVGVQGWLPKPFFVGELPALLDEAMRKPCGRPLPPSPPPALPEECEDLKHTLRRLCQEAGTLCAFVLDRGRVLAHAGTLAPTTLDPLSQATVGMERSLQQVAQAISEEGGFQQVLLEGAGYRLYLVRVAPEATLAILGESVAPLGALRYSARQAAR